MREFLVTKFVCTRCGNNLSLSYDVPKSAGKYAEGEPTGGVMVQQCVGVEPCHCVTRPAQELRNALKILQEVAR